MLLPNIFDDPFFDNFFDFPFSTGRGAKRGGRRPYRRGQGSLMRTDIRESKDGYELEVELPGYRKEEISASLDNGYLTVRAGRQEDEAPEEDAGRYLRRERYTGACERTFYVGNHLTEADIKGEFSQGILRLVLPKKEAAAAEEKHSIPIEG